MAKVALTAIRHGMPDGSVVEVTEGESVSSLPKEVVAELEKIDGVIGSPSMAPDKVDQTVTDLEAQVAELQAKLAELQGVKHTAVGPPTPDEKSSPTGPAKSPGPKAAATDGKPS